MCKMSEILRNEKYVAKVLDKYIKMVYNKNVLMIQAKMKWSRLMTLSYQLEFWTKSQHK